MVDRRIFIAVAIAALFIGVAVGHYNSGNEQPADGYGEEVATLQNQLDSEKQWHEQQRKEWDAADAAFLEHNTFFHRDSKPIIDAILHKFTISQPIQPGPRSVVKTNLGAEVNIYANGKHVTSATVSFRENKRDHGMDVVEIVAGFLVGPKRETREVAEFASLMYNSHGTVLYRYEGAIVGTVVSEEGNYKKITVNFTPTRNK